MIKLTPEEINAFNILVEKATIAKQVLDNTIASQKAFVQLCEIKYDATYDEKTGELNEKPKPEIK